MRRGKSVTIETPAEAPQRKDGGPGKNTIKAKILCTPTIKRPPPNQLWEKELEGIQGEKRSTTSALGTTQDFLEEKNCKVMGDRGRRAKNKRG